MEHGNSYSKYTTLSSKDAEEVDYAIQSLPPLTSSLTIPLLAKVMSGGNYTISVSEKENYSACLMLHDKLTGEYHDLNKGSYAFDISDTTSAPRFELVLCKMESGPVLSVEDINENNSIVIGQDADGAVVRTYFKTPAKATISAFNIVGQKLMNDIVTDYDENVTRIPVNVSNQVVIIKVTTDNESVVKKIIMH